MTKLGFIGLGNMGSAIIHGLAGKGLEIHGVDLNKGRIEELARDCGLVPAESPEALAKACDYVLLSVKPQHAEPVTRAIAPHMSGRCLLSICAGITKETLRDWTGDICPVVRVMPNTPALVNKGVFAVCLEDPNLSETQKAFCSTLFEPVGQVHVLAENLFDAFTGVIGSGPAYVLYFMEACVDACVALGLPRDAATSMVKGLFSGTATMAEESPLHITQLKEMVTSPGGTTIRGLAHMDRAAVKAAIMDGCYDSYLRSIELGQK